MQSPVTQHDWEYKLEPLKDGASKEMNVDGTSPNKTYKYAVSDGEIWYIEKVTIFLLDPGTMANNVFGSLAAPLTNGVKFSINKFGTDFKVKDLCDNVDMFMAFSSGQITGTTTTGFLNEEDYFSGSIQFKEDIRLIGEKDDVIKMVIRDDLTQIQRLRCSVLLKRPIE